MEFWNLVFPQYFRGADGELTDLEAPGIDTGAGFERILGVLADSPSLYVADSVSRLVDTAQSVTGASMGTDDRTDVALRLLADHTRTMAFLVSDGVVPSNEDRGYVLRRVIRRAVRFAYLLGVTEVVTVPLVESCIEIMGDAYPDLRDNRDLVLGICSREEEKFRQTLKTGVTILDEKLGALDEGDPLPGADAFLLHDTYGFPLEVTEEIVADRGATVDVDGFRTEMADAARAGPGRRQGHRRRHRRRGRGLSGDPHRARSDRVHRAGRVELRCCRPGHGRRRRRARSHTVLRRVGRAGG